MTRKNYPDEFKRDAVALYRDTEGATITVIAAELGVSEATLSAVQGRWGGDPAPQARLDGHDKPGGADPRAGAGPAASGGRSTAYRACQAGYRAGHSAVGGQVFRRGDELVSRFQFVADHRNAFEVKWLCALVEIARSSFYAWCAAAQGRDARAAADAALAERIRVVHDEDNTYGAPRITAELNDGVPENDRVNHKRVARVMRGVGIAGYRRKRRVKTTVPDPANQKVPDLLSRDFTAATPNTKYVGDITYLPLNTGGKLYLATVIDCCSRRVTGWAIAEHMRTELVEDALNAAAALRGTLAGAIFHADHGSQYTSKDFAKLCADLRVTQSMGAIGSSALSG